MSTPSNPLLGLAARWLRAHVATDHRADERIAALESQAGIEVQEQLGGALLPGLRRRVEASEARRQAAAAAHEQARRAGMTVIDGAEMQVRGDVHGPLPSPLLVEATRDDDVLLLVVEPADDAAEPRTWVPFQRLDLAVPGYTGQGTYDLRAAHDDDWDPLWFQLVLDHEDEPFSWVPGTGACTVSVTADCVTLEIAFEDAASRRVVLSGRFTIVLPA